MAEFNEKDLENLDKQTLITLLMNSTAAAAALQKQVEDLTKNIDRLTEEIRILRAQRYGRSSEKNLVETNEFQQMSLGFNEGEYMVDTNPDIPEPVMDMIRPKPYVRGKKMKGKRAEELKDLPVKKVEHTLTDEQLLEIFPDGKWKRLPDDVYSKLQFIPSKFEVTEHHVAVYAGNGEKSVVRADRPVELINNSIASESMVAAIANYKYVNSQPITRLAEEFKRNDIDIPSQTLCRWVIYCSDHYMIRLYNRLKEELFHYHVIHADETPVLVNRDGRPAGAKSYMWVYRSGALEAHPFVLYEYQRTRKQSHPEEFLKDFRGYCVTDGYQVYHSLEKKNDGLKIAGCWVHARRGFADVLKTFSKDQKQSAAYTESVAYKAVQLIQTMSVYEQAYAELSAEERLIERKKNVAPLVDSFFAYLRSERDRVAPKSKTGDAIKYCLNQEKYLRVFLTDGYVPMSNNAAERSVRTFCLGKKNWYVIDTISGAQASAVWYSLAETAKANHLKPYEYFKYLLEEIPKHGEFEDPAYLDDLLPWSENLPERCRKPQEKK